MRPLYLLWYHALINSIQAYFPQGQKKKQVNSCPWLFTDWGSHARQYGPCLWQRKLVSGNYEHSSLWQRQSICGTYLHDIHMCSNRRLYKNKGTMIKTKLYTIVLNIKLINWSINVALMATFQAFLYSVLLIFLVWHFIYFLIGTMVKC